MSLPSTRLAIASDYNQGLPTLIRWVHVACALIWRVAGPPHRWVHDPVRRYWALPLVLALLAFLLGPMFLEGRLDLAIFKLLNSPQLGGDIRRELETLQQWGAAGSIVIAAIIIWRQDPVRRLRLLDWGAGLLALIPIVTGLKMLIGRPRPRAGLPGPDDTFFYFPAEILWPWGAWPIDGVSHAWEFWRDISSDLWSMPSSHTAYAVAMSVFIGRVYPRLRVLAIVMAIIVGVARVVLGAHYPSDVIVGACVGYAVATPAVRFHWGRRLLKGVRRRVGRQGRRRTEGVH